MEGEILQEGPVGLLIGISNRKSKTHHRHELSLFWNSDTLQYTSMDGLDDDQRRAVQLLQEISNTTDDDVAVSVLSSVDWDIQVPKSQVSLTQLADQLNRKLLNSSLVQFLYHRLRESLRCKHLTLMTPTKESLVNISMPNPDGGYVNSNALVAPLI